MKHYQRMLTQNGAARINNFPFQTTTHLVAEQFLLIGDEDITETVLKLRSRGPSRGCLRYDVAPNSCEHFATGVAGWRGLRRLRRLPAQTRSVLSDNRPVRTPGRQRIGMNDFNARSCAIGKVADLQRIACTRQNNKGG